MNYKNVLSFYCNLNKIHIWRGFWWIVARIKCENECRGLYRVIEAANWLSARFFALNQSTASMTLYKKILLHYNLHWKALHPHLKGELGELQFYFRKIPLYQQIFWWSRFFLIRLQIFVSVARRHELRLWLNQDVICIKWQ